MYKVTAYFVDLKDNNYAYREGDTYPRKGLKADDARIAELSGSENKRGIPLIKKVDEKPAGKKAAEKNSADK